MTYSDKVKASKELLTAIQGLKDGESIKVTYGHDRYGTAKDIYEVNKNIYEIKAYKGVSDNMSYSIWSSFSGMNIDSLGPTTAKAYTYDMMSQRTSYNFPLYEMSIVVEDNNPLEKLPGFVGTEAGTL